MQLKSSTRLQMGHSRSQVVPCLLFRHPESCITMRMLLERSLAVQC